jgi:hypothetical protein
MAILLRAVPPRPFTWCAAAATEQPTMRDQPSAARRGQPTTDRRECALRRDRARVTLGEQERQATGFLPAEYDRMEIKVATPAYSPEQSDLACAVGI